MSNKLRVLNNLFNKIFVLKIFLNIFHLFRHLFFILKRIFAIFLTLIFLIAKDWFHFESYLIIKFFFFLGTRWPTDLIWLKRWILSIKLMQIGKRVSFFWERRVRNRMLIYSWDLTWKIFKIFVEYLLLIIFVRSDLIIRNAFYFLVIYNSIFIDLNLRLIRRV